MCKLQDILLSIQEWAEQRDERVLYQRWKETHEVKRWKLNHEYCLAQDNKLKPRL